MADERRRTWVLRAVGIGISLLASLAPTSAAAQEKAFYLDRLFFAGAPDDSIGMWRPHMGERTRFYGQLGFGFAYEPFRVENELQDPNKRYPSAQALRDVFDVPVTIVVTYTDGKVAEFLVPVTEASTEARFPLAGAVRSVDINPDSAAIAILDRK